MKHSLNSFNRLVDSLERLPTIGRKSATRLAYYMVLEDNPTAMRLSHAIEEAIHHIKKCEQCGGLSEDELCPICSDPNRDFKQLCIVEHAKNILMFEENGIFHGRYFVLDSLERLDTQKLFDFLEDGVKEVIFALTPSIANDAVILYIEDKLSNYSVSFSRIAQGVPTGVSLENVDILSLSRAMSDRVKV